MIRICAEHEKATKEGLVQLPLKDDEIQAVSRVTAQFAELRAQMAAHGLSQEVIAAIGQVGADLASVVFALRHGLPVGQPGLLASLSSAVVQALQAYHREWLAAGGLAASVPGPQDPSP